MDSLLTYCGYPDVVAIRYHGENPWEYDPFYWANPTESDERYAYYSIIGIPANFLDGAPTFETCFIEKYVDAIDARRSVPSPLKIVASDSTTVDSCFLKIDVVAEADPGLDSLTLRAAVTEDSIYYEAPNGQTIFNNVFRSFVPDHNGIKFTMSLGETLSFDLGFELDPAWDVSHISTVLFVQSDADQSVYQAASSRARPPGWARFSAAMQGKVGVPGEQVAYPGTLINLGAYADTFDIALSSQLAADWSASYEVTGGLAVDGGVFLESDSTCSVNAIIGCGYVPGTGEVMLTVRSRRDTTFSRTLTYFAVAGVCGLLVDDDGGLGYETYYEDALDSVGIVWGRWDRRVAQPLLSDLNGAEFVIWFTGDYFPTLEAHDQDVLASYLDGTGNLFITGQDVGYALCYINSGEYSADTKDFYETYFGAEWVMPNANLFELSGRNGDPISDGLVLTIEGGDGANNQAYPDVIDAIAPASIIFDYSEDTLKHGGVRFEYGFSKVVYLSFGFEAISAHEDRELLLSRIVNWFGKTSDVERPPLTPVVSVYPNPASTYLAIDMCGHRQGAALEIYDILGRLVFSDNLVGQKTFTWDLRDQTGREVAPGVYLVSISTYAGPIAKKVVLSR